ncbi:MAG: MFS transporter [Mycobacteriales bacterium]
MPGRRDRSEPPGPGGSPGAVPRGRSAGFRDAGPGAAERPGPRPPGKITVTRVAAARTRYLLGAGARRIGAASRAGGAGESGLTRLIWAHCAHYAADAMIAVCLAGTIFFSAARSEQRTQVALYLLVTMAPFAVVAPFIGPALDRLQRGRRLALAATALGRGLLVWIMAAQFHNGLALYPAAFGALVLSKAYAVLRGACLPRVLPAGLTLVSANARLSMFGLGAAAVGGGLLGGLISITDSYPLALRLTAAVCLGAAALSLRLPAAVDSAEGEVEATVVRSGQRGRIWQGQSLGGQVVTALRAAAALRALSGFLTLFLAFYIQSTQTGTAAAVALGGLVAAAAAGGVAGTALGARMTLSRPDPVLLTSIGGVAVISLVASLSFSLTTAILVAAAAGVANALGKLCLDAIIQREVPDALRASAFARSETLLQLAWVAGGGLGIALPPNGPLGFGAAAALLVVSLAATVLGRRRSLRPRARGPVDPAARPAPETGG